MAVVGAWLFLSGVTVAGEPSDVLRAGIAKQEITPAKPVMLAGYGSRKDLSQGVHDPLFARVVAFERNGKKLVLVSTDILGFYGGTTASMRKAICESCRLEPSELFLTAIHTHAAPVIALDGENVHPNNLEYTQDAREALGRGCARGIGPRGPRADRGRYRLVSGGREPPRVRQGSPRGKPRCGLAVTPRRRRTAKCKSSAFRAATPATWRP